MISFCFFHMQRCRFSINSIRYVLYLLLLDLMSDWHEAQHMKLSHPMMFWCQIVLLLWVWYLEDAVLWELCNGEDSLSGESCIICVRKKLHNFKIVYQNGYIFLSKHQLCNFLGKPFKTGYVIYYLNQKRYHASQSGHRRVGT